MTSQEFKAALLAKSPHYALSNEKVFEVFANKEHRQGQYSQFGPLYELYIYAFFLGIHINSRIELPPRKFTKEFAKINAWKRDSAITNFIFFVVFSRSEEIGFNWNELEHMNGKEIEEVQRNIIIFIEEYANGGLNFLKSKYENDELDNSQYLFIDLLDDIVTQIEESAEKERNEGPTQKGEVDSKEIQEEDEILSIINDGETPTVEFKSTLRVNLHTNTADKKMEHAAMKTLAAFANSSGGTLIIGVNDAKEILGLESDFTSFGAKKDLKDEFQKHLDNLIEGYFNNAFFSLVKVSFPVLDEKTVCVIMIRRSAKSHIIMNNKADGSKQEFYIRRSASTKGLEASEMIEYIRAHW